MKTINLHSEKSHFPVLLNEFIKICKPKNGKNFLDCTFGGGNYSRKILSFSGTKVSAIDRDSNALKFAEKVKKKFPKRFKFYNEKFSNIENTFKNEKFDYIIFDLGLSSYQIYDKTRGFSFNSDCKLNMKMGLSQVDAYNVINNFDEKKLKSIIKVFGEEFEARRIVKKIIDKRKKKEIFSALELRQIIESSKIKNHKKKINPSTKTFQALRIFVNKEISELIEGINQATKILKSGGKIFVISFHSIEDKIVKFFFKNFSNSRSGNSRYLPENKNKNNIFFKNYDNKIIRPSPEEIAKNPNSRSAKLRFATRNNQKHINSDELYKKFENYLYIEGLNEK
tara:strand:- start:636 stop:1652 length:1017 start_codon:yes stop_codon:yes gene_type:complete